MTASPCRPKVCAMRPHVCAASGSALARLPIVIMLNLTKWRRERPNKRDRPEQPAGRNPDPAHGVNRGSLRMTPFVSELTRQFAHIDDDDYSRKNENREHNKSECVQRAE